MSKIAVFVIATNKYLDFVEPLYKSMQNYFLVGHQKDIFVFTNRDSVPGNCKRVEVEAYGWPYASLMRYHMIYNNMSQYQYYDYYYYVDADMLFLQPVGEEVFGSFTCVLHPGFYYHLYVPTFERRAGSCAYVDDNGDYYAGGFNGGSNFLMMAFAIKLMTDIDLYKNFLPVWYDESYLNKYARLFPPDTVLTPDYCYPENRELNERWHLLDIKPKILALDKNKDEIRKPC